MQGVKNLMDRLGRMKATKPLFVDFTWGAGGSTADLTLELTMRTKNEHGLVPNMHLTCTNMPVEKIDNALAKCKVRTVCTCREWQQTFIIVVVVLFYVKLALYIVQDMNVHAGPVVATQGTLGVGVVCAWCGVFCVRHASCAVRFDALLRRNSAVAGWV